MDNPHIDVETKTREMPPRFSTTDPSMLSVLTIAGVSIFDTVASDEGSMTSTSPVSVPPEASRTSAAVSERASSHGCETASDNGTGEREASSPLPEPIPARRLVFAIPVPQKGEMQYGGEDFYVTVACKVVVPFAVTLKMKGDILLQQGIKIEQRGIAEVLGSLSSNCSLEIGQNGRLETIGDYHLPGGIEVGQDGLLILPGTGTCGSSISTINVGFRGKMLIGSDDGRSDLAAKSIYVEQTAELAVVGDVECTGKAVVAFDGKILTSGNFSCSGKISVDQKGIFSVGGDASFNGVVTIGYGGTFKIGGDATFALPIQLDFGGNISVKSGTIFPSGSVLDGSIEYI